MGKQYNRREKAARRKRYNERLKERIKAGAKSR